MHTSPVLALYDPQRYEFDDVGGMRIASRLRAQTPTHEVDFLADVSALRRRLCVGRSAGAWLTRHGLPAVDGLHRCAVSGTGVVVARIHRHQWLVVAAPGAAGLPDDLADGRHDDVLVLPYEAAEFAARGAATEHALAELCAMDTTQITPAHWTLTRIAHCEAALRVVGAPRHYRILCTPADARFLFGVLADVMTAAGAALIGFDDYHRLVHTENGPA